MKMRQQSFCKELSWCYTDLPIISLVSVSFALLFCQTEIFIDVFLLLLLVIALDAAVVSFFPQSTKKL